MRVRTTIILVSAVAVLIASAAFWPTNNRKGPEVRLSGLGATGIGSAWWSRTTEEDHLARILGVEPSAWRAAFEITNFPENHAFLSFLDPQVEVLRSDNTWEPVPAGGKISLPPLFSQPLQIISLHMEVIVPSGTRICRFKFQIRPPTPRERCTFFLANHGLSRRYPRFAAWISRRFSSMEKWRECQREVELSGFPLEHGTHNPAHALHAAMNISLNVARHWSGASDVHR